MNIDYHALLPINNKKFANGYTARVLNIPGPSQNSTVICYSIRFEGSSERLLNLWVAQETLMLNPQAKTAVFQAVDHWLITEEGFDVRVDRFFDENSSSLVPYDPKVGPIKDQPSANADDRLTILLSGLDSSYSAAFRSAWSIRNHKQRVDSLIELAKELPPEPAEVVYQEIIETLSHIADVDRRRESAVQLAKQLPQHLLFALLESFKKEPDDNNRVRLITSLMGDLPLSSLDALLKEVDSFDDPIARDSFLASLINHMAAKGAVTQAFEAAELISDPDVRDNSKEQLLKFVKRPPVDERPTLAVTGVRHETVEGEQTTPDLESSQQTLGGLIEIASRALADTPNAELDLLDFAEYADALSDLISSDKTGRPLTIGIDAAWGMGKTQLMKMIRKRLTIPGGSELHDKLKVRSAFPTVWFNAWKYDKEDALWAALVLEILNQIEKDLGFWRRLHMQVKLKWKRLDKGALLKAMTISFVSLLVAAGILLLLKRIPSLSSLTIGIIGLVSAIGALYPTVKNVYQQIKSLEQKLSQYIRNPNYQEKVGFLAQFEEDFGRVIDLVTQEGKWPLVVFIDDLDRCAPTKAVEIIEAINILLDAKHCVFVIGMDAKTVAQSIQTKYKSLEGGYPDEAGGLTLGERFLEKIIQISFRIPRSHKSQVERLIEKHLEGVQSARTVEVQENAIELKVKLAEQIIQAEQRGGKVLSEATVLATTKIAESNLGISKDDINQASEDLRMKAFEDDKNVHQAVKEAAPYLDFNPRKIKRFINNFRLYALIAQKRGLMSRGGFGIGLLAKATIISMRWPDLAMHMTKDGSLCQNLKDAYHVQELVREGAHSPDANQAACAQIKLDKLSANETIKRFINATDLSNLLSSIENSDIAGFARCFQLHQSSESLNGAVEPPL